MLTSSLGQLEAPKMMRKERGMFSEAHVTSPFQWQGVDRHTARMGGLEMEASPSILFPPECLMEE